jgi:recombination protein RecR
MKEELLPEKFVQLIEFFASLPGVGKKTAVRYALHVYNHQKEKWVKFSQLFIDLQDQIKTCTICHNMSETEVCKICSNVHRDHSLICVVRDVRDILAIENTGRYRGVYHVLGGLISPIDGINPEQLTFDALIKRLESNKVNELIAALNTTPEGETTLYYLYKITRPYNITLSTISRGVGIGDELEYTDEVTLANSIENRVNYENLLHSK